MSYWLTDWKVSEAALDLRLPWPSALLPSYPSLFFLSGSSRGTDFLWSCITCLKIDSDKRNTVVSSLLPGNLTSREEWLSQQRRLKIDTMPRCQLNFVTGFNLFFWKSTYLFKKWFTVPKLSTSSLVSPLWRGPINISVFLGILILLCCLGSSPYICPPFLLACLLLAYFINSIIRTLENRKKGIFFQLLQNK